MAVQRAHWEQPHPRGVAPGKLTVGPPAPSLSPPGTLPCPHAAAVSVSTADEAGNGHTICHSADVPFIH